MGLLTIQEEFGVLCCLTTPGLRKDIRRQIRQLYSLTIQEESFERVASIRVHEFPEVFDRQLGKLAGKQTLRLKEDSQPVVMASRRVSVNQRPALKKELDRLTKLGVIEHVSKPTPWLSKLVVATKNHHYIKKAIHLGATILTLRNFLYLEQQLRKFEKISQTPCQKMAGSKRANIEVCRYILGAASILSD